MIYLKHLLDNLGHLLQGSPAPAGKGRVACTGLVNARLRPVPPPDICPPSS